MKQNGLGEEQQPREEVKKWQKVTSKGLEQWKHSEKKKKNTANSCRRNPYTWACTRLSNEFPDLEANDIQWLFKERVTPEGWSTWDTHMTLKKEDTDQLILLINICNSPWSLPDFKQSADLVPQSVQWCLLASSPASSTALSGSA